MNNTRKFFMVLSCLTAVSSTVVADDGDNLESLQEQVESLQQGQQQMQKDLAEIKKLLQQGARAPAGQQPFKPTDTQLGDAPFKGSADAPVTVIEFSDYQCPYCRRHATTVMPELLKSYVDSGQLKLVMREFPIPNLHPRATAAAEAALCARDQGAYWEMHDQLFSDQKAMTDENFKGYAVTLGLDEQAFAECLDSDRNMAQIRADQAEGQKLGISGTPSFVVGRTDPDDSGTVHLTHFIRGAKALPSFTGIIDELLADPATGE